jgi:pimeloyl-ACP methyl ester carboxylesterase
MILCLGLIMPAFHAAAAEEWSPEVFDYDPPSRLEVHDAPTRAAYHITGTRQEQVVFKDVRGHEVPVLITMPKGREGPFPVVVLVHGFSNNKEGVTHQLGGELTARGFACVAMDMPHHGERPGKPPGNMFGPDNKAAYENVVQAVKDVRQTIDFAETRRDFDTSNGVYLVGYSMGSWIGTLAGAADRRVAAMVLMVGGSAVSGAKPAAKEDEPSRRRRDLVQHYPALRHNLALTRFSPRPVLLMNGEKDLLVPADRAKILFESAREPREQRWYKSGHLLPAAAYRDAVEWLVRQVRRPS